ncbi:MAG: response regulator [Paracraurococcus sp.]|jgi:CheY-like chemotaxis protein
MTARRVLIVDDNDAARRLLRIACEANGAEVQDCIDAEGAVAALAEGHFDLILLDCHLPMTDGRDLARQLREGGFAGRVVAATADALLPLTEPETLKDFDEVLIKPIPLARIEAELVRLSPG